jgi:predicted nucleic acid-binding protein
VIVVSDTSPLNYLILVNAIDVLPTLFGEVHVPPKIVEELQRSRAPSPVKTWAASLPAWVRIQSPSTKLVTSVRLDPGEAQAIALAKELQADVILIDERKGRRVAKDHGLRAIGTLTVLEFAAERDLLDLKAATDALQSTTFHIATEQINAALKRDTARKSQ